MGLLSTTKKTSTTMIDQSYQQEIGDNSIVGFRGDYGLTGANIVNLAGVQETGATAREQIRSETILALNQQAGAGVTYLIGGASDLIQASRENLSMNNLNLGNFAKSYEQVYQSGLAQSQESLRTGQETLITMADKIKGEESKQMGQVISLGILVFFGFMLLKG